VDLSHVLVSNLATVIAFASAELAGFEVALSQ